MLDLVQHFFQNPSLSSNPGRPSQNLFSQRRLTEESRCPPQTILKCLKASFIASSFSEWQFSSTPSQLFLPVLILRYSSASIPMLTVYFGRGFWLINKTTVSTYLPVVREYNCQPSTCFALCKFKILRYIELIS